MIFKIIISILLHEISIWYNRKIELNIWYRNLCFQLQRSDVSCSSWSSLHTLQEGFWPTPPYRSSPDLSGFGGCRWATQSFSSLHRFSIGFRSGDWRLQDLEMLLTEPLLSCPCCVLSCWKTQPQPIFNALTEGKRLLAKISRYMAPSILPSIRCSRPVPFAEKHPQNIVSTPMLHSRDGVLGIVLILPFSPNTASGVYTKKLYFGLIWPHDLLSCLL